MLLNPGILWEIIRVFSYNSSLSKLVLPKWPIFIRTIIPELIRRFLPIPCWRIFKLIFRWRVASFQPIGFLFIHLKRPSSIWVLVKTSNHGFLWLQPPAVLYLSSLGDNGDNWFVWNCFLAKIRFLWLFRHLFFLKEKSKIILKEP